MELLASFDTLALSPGPDIIQTLLAALATAVRKPSTPFWRQELLWLLGAMVRNNWEVDTSVATSLAGLLDK